MAIKLWGPIVTSLRDRLETDLPATIDTINSTETSPSYPIPYPGRVLDFIPPVADMFALPIVAISDGPLTFRDDTGWGATSVAELTVVAFLQGTDQRQLAWQLRRYAMAITRVTLANRSIGPDGWGVIMRGVRPGPTLGRDSDPKQYLSTVAVSIEVRSEADTP